MKALAVILSVYVLVLAVMPCPCQRASLRQEDKQTCSVVDCGCDHDEGDVDLCTPFCVVSQCMHTPVVLFSHEQCPTPAAAVQCEGAACYHQDKPLSVFRGSVWRPPIMVV